MMGFSAVTVRLRLEVSVSVARDERQPDESVLSGLVGERELVVLEPPDARVPAHHDGPRVVVLLVLDLDVLARVRTVGTECEESFQRCLLTYLGQRTIRDRLGQASCVD